MCSVKRCQACTGADVVYVFSAPVVGPGRKFRSVHHCISVENSYCLRHTRGPAESNVGIPCLQQRAACLSQATLCVILAVPECQCCTHLSKMMTWLSDSILPWNQPAGSPQSPSLVLQLSYRQDSQQTPNSCRTLQLAGCCVCSTAVKASHMLQHMQCWRPAFSHAACRR
jgi:hypothetical protein